MYRRAQQRGIGRKVEIELQIVHIGLKNRREESADIVCNRFHFGFGQDCGNLAFNVGVQTCLIDKGKVGTAYREVVVNKTATRQSKEQ